MSDANKPIETRNKFMVSLQGDRVLVMNPPRGPISHDDALLLAAYLVALAFQGEHTFEEVREAVEST